MRRRQHLKIERDIKRLFAENVKRIRELRGLSQADLARKAGVTRSSISAIELCRNAATLGHLAVIAFHLEVQPTDLLGVDK